MLAFASAMDSVFEIKARLPIEELVGQYCQLKKKGRNYVALCPFHNDTHPSMNVSPDKGIAYCFACQKGGDIFSFYQAIEGVDFREALNDLAEKTGVKLERAEGNPVRKDEKERFRECLDEAKSYYVIKLKESSPAREYLAKRNANPEMLEKFSVGFAPDSFSETYNHLLKKGFSKNEILASGLAVQKDLAEGKIYDRFRNRIMFPIFDHRGDIAGFGGRAIGEGDAKYLNSSEGPLYNKSQILFGFDKAKESIRETKEVILVEGYFDVLACHLAGVTNCAAVSGTALTEHHVKILKRYADNVLLCLDQDKAGRDAEERSFVLCAKNGMQVKVISLNSKDPDEAVRSDLESFKKLFAGGGIPYMDMVLKEIESMDLASADGKRQGLSRIMPLLDAIPSAVEKDHEIARFARAFSTSVPALSDDLSKFRAQNRFSSGSSFGNVPAQAQAKPDIFTRVEVALGLFLIFPGKREYIKELIPPESGFGKLLFNYLSDPKDGNAEPTLPAEFSERLAILKLYCEHNGFTEWSDSAAVREIRSNISRANKETIRIKQLSITKELLQAQKGGRESDAFHLMNQYQQVLKLAKKAG